MIFSSSLFFKPPPCRYRLWLKSGIRSVSQIPGDFFFVPPQNDISFHSSRMKGNLRFVLEDEKDCFPEKLGSEWGSTHPSGVAAVATISYHGSAHFSLWHILALFRRHQHGTYCQHGLMGICMSCLRNHAGHLISCFCSFKKKMMSYKTFLSRRNYTIFPVSPEPNPCSFGRKKWKQNKKCSGGSDHGPCFQDL